MSEKKMVSRNVALTLGIVCIILVAGVIAVIASMLNTASGLTQKYAKESTLRYSWEQENIPNDLDDLFQNKVVLWSDKELMEPSNTEANETLIYDFNQTGCLWINITSSTSDWSWARIEWYYESIHPAFHNVTVNYATKGPEGLFPVLKGVTRLQIYSGALNFSETRNENQTLTIVYYY